MLKIAFCDDETQETRRLEALLEEYAADRVLFRYKGSSFFFTEETF